MGIPFKGILRLSVITMPLKNQQHYPLIDFLNFLIENRERYSLQIKIQWSINTKRITRIAFRFHEEEEKVINISELTLVEYLEYMGDTNMFLAVIREVKDFKRLYDRYVEIEQKHQGTKDLYEHELMLEKGGSLSFIIDPQFLIQRMNTQQHLMNECVNEGALFIQRFDGMYTDYQESLIKKQVAVLPSPANDHIEVELLTILEDPEVTDETKEEARSTLDKYRLIQQETIEVGNQKDENARLAIRTIQEHYLTNG